VVAGGGGQALENGNVSNASHGVGGTCLFSGWAPLAKEGGGEPWRRDQNIRIILRRKEAFQLKKFRMKSGERLRRTDVSLGKKMTSLEKFPYF